jgi:hypothetical protein
MGLRFPSASSYNPSMRVSPFQPEERPTGDWPTDDVARPGAWPVIRHVEFEAGERPGDYTTIRYSLGPIRSPEGWTDPLVQVDRRERRLVEAFTSIKLTERPESAGTVEYTPDAAQLEAFVLAFGPVLVEVDLQTFLMQRFGASAAEKRPGDPVEAVGEWVHTVDATCALADALARHDYAALFRTLPLGLRDQPSDPDALEQVGRWQLSWLLGQYLRPGLEVDVVVGKDGRLGAALRPTSLIQVMGWQLLEQIRRRPARSSDSIPDPMFELPQCGYCGGRILSTRLAEGNVNRWHIGCKAAGQARERRRRRSRKDDLE